MMRRTGPALSAGGLFALVALLALLPRLWRLDAQSLWLDEGSTWAEVENAMRSLRHHPTADGGHEGEGEDAGDGTALSCCLQGAAQGPQDGGAGLLRRRAPGTSASTIAPADRQA